MCQVFHLTSDASAFSCIPFDLLNDFLCTYTDDGHRQSNQ